MISDAIQNSKDYIFTSLNVDERIKQTSRYYMMSWTIDPESRTANEIEEREERRERYLEPFVTTQIQYKDMLI